MALDEYRRKRDFRKSPEPQGKSGTTRAYKPLRFVVQKHAATRLHYDFRLELDGVLKSWAVPKGPSLVAGERRLAAQTEDHPIEYADFEGVIPAGEYGGGPVIVWDRGTWAPIGDPRAGLEKGDLSFVLAGEKLRGRWHLARMRARSGDRGKASWLLIKGRDGDARGADAPSIVDTAPLSVLSGRDIAAVKRASDRVWSSKHGERNAPTIAAPGDPSGVAGAKQGALPERLEPQLATLVDVVPAGEAWLHELKLDGHRVGGRVEAGTARLLTPGGEDCTERFASLAEALESLPLGTAWVDGEVVVLDEHGRSDVERLQRVLGGERGPLQLFLFDLLYLDGFDLRRVRLEDRKRLLRERMIGAASSAPLRLNDHVRGRGKEIYAAACQRGVGGVISKRADAPSQPGRSRSWVEVRCTPQGNGDGTPNDVWFDADTPAAREARSAVASSATSLSTSEVAGVRLSTPDRVYYPDDGITKRELADYWEAVADRALPLLARRPLSMVRCPESIAECFYQKRVSESIPDSVPRVVVKSGREPYAMVDDLRSLISLVQVGVLEFHVWGARADRLDRPDLVVFDLDPDPELPWRSTAETAVLLRELLNELGLVSFVRSTGGKGLHVVAPLERRATWDEVKGFSHALAQQFARTAPARFTTTVTKSRRKGKILIDYLRNDPESTAIATWSPRARAGAPVAAALAWAELDADERPEITVRDAHARLMRPDPWSEFDNARRPLTRAMQRRVGTATR
ncbi:MAG TPA: non-homologous end-joining DNA ligase [Gemmatimonadaceae bacterium]|nr:non-homologous end-joining DNA ligase [Gemmatimonadaceae bacterium]